MLHIRHILFFLAIALLALTCLCSNDDNYEIYLVTSTPPDNHKGTVMNITNHEGHNYECHIPVLSSEQSDNNIQGNQYKETEQQKAERFTELRDILQTMSKSCFFRITGYWIYELCLFQHVRQFHQEDQQVTINYYLGHAHDSSTRNAEIDTQGAMYADKVPPFELHGLSPNDDEDGSVVDANINHSTDPYISIQMVNGTMCDLTGRPRTTELRIYCSQQLQASQSPLLAATHGVTGQSSISMNSATNILSIEESKSCEYIISMQTDRVCSHPYFVMAKANIEKAQKSKTHPIYCYRAEQPSPSPTNEQFDEQIEQTTSGKIEATETVDSTKDEL